MEDDKKVSDITNKHEFTPQMSITSKWILQANPCPEKPVG